VISFFITTSALSGSKMDEDPEDNNSVMAAGALLVPWRSVLMQKIAAFKERHRVLHDSENPPLPDNSRLVPYYPLFLRRQADWRAKRIAAKYTDQSCGKDASR
jgi:hypothetical protein